MASRSPHVSIALFMTLATCCYGVRMVHVARHTGTENENLNGTENAESEFCNPFSSMPLKHYRFDVRISGEDCEKGICMAIMLIRDKEDPTLEIHYGKSWIVKREDCVDTDNGATDNEGDGCEAYTYPGDKSKWDDSDFSANEMCCWAGGGKTNPAPASDQLVWKLNQWNPSVETSYKVLKLVDMHEIYFKESNADAGKLDTLHIKWGPREDHDEIKIAGGLFYEENMILEGLDKIRKAEGDAYEEDLEKNPELAYEKGKDGARRDNIIIHNGKNAGRAGLVVGTVGVGGYFTAAVVGGVAISNTGLLAGAMAGAVGGVVAGSVIGLVIGGVVGLAGLAGWIRLVRDYGLSASEKIWSKLWCINKFKSCYKGKFIDGQRTTLIVPNSKACPQQ